MELRLERDRLKNELTQIRQKTVRELEDLHDVLHQAQTKAEADQREKEGLRDEIRRLEGEPVGTKSKGDPPQLTPTVDLSKLGRSEPTPLLRRRWVVPAISAAVALIVGVPVGTLLAGNGGDQPEEPVSTPSVDQGEEPPVETTDAGPPPINRWVPIEPPSSPVTLGLPGWLTSPGAKGFRATRGITSPRKRYEIQQHEVTRAELRPWLAKRPFNDFDPSWLERPDGAEETPVTNIPMEIARGYCKSAGGDLPTEEQWEYAARGPQLRFYPWGNQPIDLERTHVFRPGKALSRSMTNDQDRTPGDPDLALYDLLGNAQEWTRSLWRENEPGQDESWVRLGGRTYRAVRGLAPSSSPPEDLPVVGAAFRRVLCATGDCPDRAEEARETVGFRCVRE